MPTETFFKLSEEKKRKIIEAGKEEFSKVSLEEASIKNIAEKAGIARGSFYQYFESKKDLLYFILEENRETIEKKLNTIIREVNGDIFALYVAMYDDMTSKCFDNRNQDIYRRIFENVKTNDDSLYEGIEYEKERYLLNLESLINKQNLKIETDLDYDLMIQILNAVTMSSVVRSIKYKSREEARQEFLRKIEFIEYGICKK